MTLQQLRYIIAINHYRNFAKAAESEGVSQPTLSAMLVKLEEELDVRIFERSNKSHTHHCRRKIIRQAEHAVIEADRISELIAEDKGIVSGNLSLAIGPTIAPYILPQFIRYYLETYPQVNLSIMEQKAENMLESLRHSQVDAGIAISGHRSPGILEISLYTENFWVYLAENCWRKAPSFTPEMLEHENMWIMKEAQCLRDSAFSFCKARAKGHHIYEIRQHRHSDTDR